MSIGGEYGRRRELKERAVLRVCGGENREGVTVEESASAIQQSVCREKVLTGIL